MFLVEIDGVRVLYTGDYSREEDRHLNPAEIPDCTVDVLIVESTYGVKDHEPRHKREVLCRITCKTVNNLLEVPIFKRSPRYHKARR